MHPFRRGLVPMYLAGAAAVSTVVSIAAFEILMGAALLALIVTHAKGRIPRIWLPFSIFMAGTIVSLAASGHFRQGLPQVKKFYVFLMVVLVTGAFSSVRADPLGGVGVDARCFTLCGVGPESVLQQIRGRARTPTPTFTMPMSATGSPDS